MENQTPDPATAPAAPAAELDPSLYKFVPSAVKAGKFEGHIIVKELCFDERYDLLEKLAAIPDTDAAARVTFMRHLIKNHKDKLVSVALRRVKDGRRYDSYDALEYGADAHDVRIEVGKGLLYGFDEGNG